MTDHKSAFGHQWDGGTEVVNSTCNGKDMTEYKCERCDEHRLKSEFAEGHTPGTAVTCTEPQTCTVCGAILAKAFRHYFVDQVTAPTCLEQGFTSHACDRCGEGMIIDHQDALGHDWDEGTVMVNSTCNGKGMIEYKCKRCDAHRLESESSEGHTPGEPATCTEPQTCTVCGATLAKAFGHHFVDQVTVPTCLEQGFTSHACDRCGEWIITDYKDAFGHDWDEGTVMVNSTCNGKGMIEYKCKRCDAHRLESESSEGHTPGAAATCTEPQTCIVCGAILAKALGHHVVDQVTVPTCLEQGFTSHAYDRCGEGIITDYKDALGHDLDEGTAIVNSTCNSKGITEYKCKHCDVHRLESGSAEVHTPGAEATCTEPQTCTVCGAILAKALGHHVVDQVTAPTCLEQGFTSHACDRCGERIITNYKDALGHDWDEGTAIVNSTCNGKGMTEYKCKRCDVRRLESESAEGHTPSAKANCTEL